MESKNHLKFMKKEEKSLAILKGFCDVVGKYLQRGNGVGGGEENV